MWLCTRYVQKNVQQVSVCTPVATTCVRNPKKPQPKKFLRLHHPVSILLFPTRTCSTGWLSINHNKWRLLGFPRHAFLLIFDDAFVWTLSNCVRSLLAIRASQRSSRQLLLLDIICGFCPASLFMQIMARVVSFSLFRRGIARNTQLFWKRSRIDENISFCWSFWWTLWQLNDASAEKFFNSLHVLLVFVNPCLASFDSNGIGSKFHVLQYPLGSARHAQHVGVLVRPFVSECYFQSFRGASCLANNSLHYSR